MLVDKNGQFAGGNGGMVENKSKCTEFYARYIRVTAAFKIDLLVDGTLMVASGYGDSTTLGLYVVFVLQNTYVRFNI